MLFLIIPVIATKNTKRKCWRRLSSPWLFILMLSIVYEHTVFALDVKSGLLSEECENPDANKARLVTREELAL